MTTVSAEEFISAVSGNSTWSNNSDTKITYTAKVLDDGTVTREQISTDPFAIDKVIFNYPATIVLWEEGTKTVVKCAQDEPYDPEKGLAMCIAKKALGDNYKRAFKTWRDPELLKHTILSIRVDPNSKAMDRLMDAIDRGYVPDD